MMLSPVQQTALQSPNNTAVLLEGKLITYASWAAQISALSENLQQQGVTPGVIIAAVIPTSVSATTTSNHNLAQQTFAIMTLYWACVEIGAIFFPINGRFSDSQIEQLIKRFQIHFIWQPSEIVSREFRPGLIDLAHKVTANRQLDKSQRVCAAQKVNPHKPVNIILTSGSSGTPKAAVHALINHIASAQGSSRYIPLQHNDRWLLSLPLFHIGGLAIVNRCALAAAAIVIKSNQMTLAQQLKDEAITHVSMVPTQALQILQQAPQALSALKALLLGGGVIEAGLIEALAQKKVNTYTSYGMTEMSSQITTAKANLQHHLGRPLPNRQLKLVDDVIWVKGECLFQGYLNINAQQQYQLDLPIDDQGWFCTQDRGQFNEKGQLILLGRVDNMFICGGENIQPEEIESVLLKHPLVSKALVFGLADNIFGLLPAAIIEYKQAELPVNIEHQLTQLVIQQLASFKRPRHFYAWPNITMDGLKVNRKRVISEVINTKNSQ
ncbi:MULTISPECIES: o-succinylbenzoate--CoA ligase [Pseudomonadati]|uniref:O-succinylbenzoate--CoA ligase n=1 Tax=Shewanella aestuarii TaxID=1028752 RepID=A0ABT0L2T9_9GAMM|nr:o-succinylbenzoate--CoA ligase [Shewanella aestuarii]MCL1118023.1 o-succinylbenzoate--CoA ligase [Shewanella aestuarii]GGN79510.1 2-succinylbenzoate-CoA ligase [Shewanella aestuarii]